jgi:hypothetical protein
MDLQPKGAISTVKLIEAFPVLFITFLASIYALLKIPALGAPGNPVSRSLMPFQKC